MTSLFLPRESLVSDIPAGGGNIEKLFLQCRGSRRKKTYRKRRDINQQKSINKTNTAGTKTPVHWGHYIF
jgi:hypothetical protein